MFCEKCGKELPNGSKFCTYCGASLTEENSNVGNTLNTENTQAPKVETNKAPKAPKKIKLSKKKLIIGGAAVVVVVLLIVIVTATGLFKPKYSVLGDNILKYTGANGYGTAQFDYDSISENVIAEAKNLEATKTDIDIDKIRAYNIILENINCSIEAENNGKLSNGDKVLVVCNYATNKEAAVKNALKTVGYKITDMSKSYTVSGLAELPVVDFFEGLEVAWDEGYSEMYPSPKINNQYSKSLNYNYEYDKDTGDMKVYITNDMDYIIENLQVTGDLEKTIHVGKAPVHIKSLDSQELIDKATEIAWEGITQNENVCGSVIYPSTGNLQTDLIVSKEVVDISQGSEMVFKFLVTCEHNQYYKYVKFKMYQNEDGTFTYNFTNDLTACSASKQYYRDENLTWN